MGHDNDVIRKNKKKSCIRLCFNTILLHTSTKKAYKKLLI